MQDAAGKRREDAGIGAGKPGLAAEPPDLVEQRHAPAFVQIGRHIVEQQQRRLGGEARGGQHQRDQQRLLLAGRAVGGRHAAFGVGDGEVAAMRACARAAGLGVAAAPFGERLDQPVLGLQRRSFLQPGIDLALQRHARLREGPAGGCKRRAQPLHQVAPAGGDGNAALGHTALQGGEPVAVRGAGPQQGKALAHRRLVGLDPPGMGGIDRQDQPVEETPACACAVEEQPVHLRRQPDGRRPPLRARAGPRRRYAPRAGRLRRGRCRYRPSRMPCRAAPSPSSAPRPAGSSRAAAPGAARAPARAARALRAGWSCRRRSAR